jgi:Co/Zn/Cd efflux system component
MLIWMLLFFFGLGISVLGLVWLAVGVAKKNKKKVVLGILMPVLYWSCFAILWEADRRFIQEETRKNGGELPDWVW